MWVGYVSTFTARAVILPPKPAGPIPKLLIFSNNSISNSFTSINEGVRQGYVDGFLRKSVVNDPILRVNTKDNTPAVIHYSVVSGDKVKLTLSPKGFFL